MSTRRQGLEHLGGERARFSATFERYGSRPKYRRRGVVRTVLLGRVIHVSTGEVVTDHLWFTQAQCWRKLGHLEPGAKVGFDARVKEYRKGRWGGRTWDLKLSNPTKVSIVGKENRA